MTMSALVRVREYPGDGATVTFSVPFQFYAGTELEVVLRDAYGVETVKTLSTHYTVAGGVGATGSVTFLAAPSAGLTVALRGKTARSQEVSYVADDAFPATSHQEAIDRRAAVDIEQDDAIADTRHRALLMPQGEALAMSPLDALDGKLLAVSEGRVVGVNPASSGATPLDTLFVLHEGVPLSSIINSMISLDPAEIITVTGSTTLDATAIGRAVIVSSLASAMQLDMPPVTSANIGDAILILVEWSCTALVDCRGFPASGHLFGDAAQRIMRAGETALLRFTGTGWSKVAGVTRPHTGVLLMAGAGDQQSLVWGTDGLNWKRVPLTQRQADNEPSHPWFVTDHIQPPRNGQYHFHGQFWFNGITMAAPTYGHVVNNPTYSAQALSGTEQGLPCDFGICITYNSAATAARFGRKIVRNGQAFEEASLSWSAFLGPSDHVGLTFRLGAAALTGLTACYVNNDVRSCLQFWEVPEW